ncbi:hypothetical protein HMI56_004650 [Coelomomyces lativittatus]|nr:hypothetical protein HMI56_004650 [Coelomomyces lativittatus]
MTEYAVLNFDFNSKLQTEPQDDLPSNLNNLTSPSFQPQTYQHVDKTLDSVSALTAPDVRMAGVFSM